MKPRQPVFVTLFWVLFLIVGAFYMFVQNWSFLTSTIFIATVVISILLVLIIESLNKIIDSEKFKELSPAEKAKYIADSQVPYFQRIWKSGVGKVDVREETEMILDHGYDGIYELDNQLPKWWLALFYFGVGYCVIYLLAFSFTDFAHPDAEYTKEYEEQMASVAAYEATVADVTFETSEYKKENIEKGKELFKTHCATCHGENGEGGIGPNLTDDYWMNVEANTLFKNVFYMDWFGSKNNPSMRAFGAGGDIKGRDIEKIAAYITYINQDIPDAPGAKQGTKIDWKALESGGELPAYNDAVAQ